MDHWFDNEDCIRDNLSGRYPGRDNRWITGCSVRDNASDREYRIRKCAFCAGPEGIILLLNCLVRGGGCVLAGSGIRLADGSKKFVEDVVTGDRVRACIVENGSVLNAVVGRVAHHRPEEMGDYYLLLNGVLRITPYHPMHANGEWIPAGGLREGDVLMTMYGSSRIESIEVIYERAPVYDLVLEGPIAYFADDIAVPTKTGFASYFKKVGSPIRGNFDRTTRKKPRDEYPLHRVL